MACGLALLETTFIAVGLLILHGMRKMIGTTAFHIAIGFLLVFTQLVSAIELKVVFGMLGADFYLAQTVFFLPYLMALLIVYVTEGTLAAQRLIVGAMAALGMYMYLSHLTAIQCDWYGYAIAQGPSADALDFLLRKSQRAMGGSILAQTLDLFLIPIFFQRLRNLKCRMFFCVVGALILTQFVDNFVYVTVVHWGSAQWWYQIQSSYIAKLLLTVWLSVFATLYISRIEKEVPGEGRGTLDIILALFGSYGKARTLQQQIQNWVDRYKMVVENASDMILLVDEKGMILDANFAAFRILQLNLKTEIIGRSFPDMVLDKRQRPIQWEEYCASFHEQDTSMGAHIIQRLECLVDSPKKERVELDIAITSVKGVEDMSMFIVMGRDVTERNRLEREREQLREQLVHTQRIESIGKLAGGVAHDFNNYLHAIQGHLDLIKYMHEVEDEEINHHLERIDDMTDKASHLTAQLLGFARKGKYIEKSLDLRELLEKTVELFMPNTQAGVDFKFECVPSEAWARGDEVQLQQVFLNILLNARHAVRNGGKDGKDDIFISMTLDYATAANVMWAPPSEVKLDRSDFHCVTIADNGEGMDEKNLNHIFEPFFTTKPFGEGTGMGLAMAYGSISGHGGWIGVESEKGKGTTFYVFLPICRREKNGEAKETKDDHEDVVTRSNDEPPATS